MGLEARCRSSAGGQTKLVRPLLLDSKKTPSYCQASLSKEYLSDRFWSGVLHCGGREDFRTLSESDYAITRK